MPPNPLAKPSKRFNFLEGIQVFALEDIKQYDVVEIVGLAGQCMSVRKATPKSIGKLLIAKHDAPGCESPKSPDSRDSLCIVLPWIVATKNVDTRGLSLHDVVLLGDKGQWVPGGGKTGRKIGHVIQVGPPSALEDGETGCGAIHFDPNSP